MLDSGFLTLDVYRYLIFHGGEIEGVIRGVGLWKRGGEFFGDATVCLYGPKDWIDDRKPRDRVRLLLEKVDGLANVQKSDIIVELVA